MADLMGDHGVAFLRREHVQEALGDDHPRIAREMAEGEGVRVPVPDDAKAGDRDVALTAEVFQKGLKLRGNFTGLHPADVEKELEDEGAKKVLERHDGDAETDGPAQRQVKLIGEGGSNRIKKAEQQSQDKQGPRDEVPGHEALQVIFITISGVRLYGDRSAGYRESCQGYRHQGFLHSPGRASALLISAQPAAIPAQKLNLEEITKVELAVGPGQVRDSSTRPG